jgi:hypothetical protein
MRELFCRKYFSQGKKNAPHRPHDAQANHQFTVRDSLAATAPLACPALRFVDAAKPFLVPAVSVAHSQRKNYSLYARHVCVKPSRPRPLVHAVTPCVRCQCCISIWIINASTPATLVEFRSSARQHYCIANSALHARRYHPGALRSPGRLHRGPGMQSSSIALLRLPPNARLPHFAGK